MHNASWHDALRNGNMAAPFRGTEVSRVTRRRTERFRLRYSGERPVRPVPLPVPLPRASPRPSRASPPVPLPVPCLSECIALMPAGSTATIDPGFAKDVEAAIAAHREPLEPPVWD